MPAPPLDRKSPVPESGNRPVCRRVPQTNNTINEQRVGVIKEGFPEEIPFEYRQKKGEIPKEWCKGDVLLFYRESKVC